MEQIVVNIPRALPKMTCLHEEVSMQKNGMKFIAHKPFHIISWGKELYHVVVYAKIVIILHVGSHISPSNIQHLNIKSIRFLLVCILILSNKPVDSRGFLFLFLFFLVQIKTRKAGLLFY